MQRHRNQNTHKCHKHYCNHRSHWNNYTSAFRTLINTLPTDTKLFQVFTWMNHSFGLVEKLAAISSILVEARYEFWEEFSKHDFESSGTSFAGNPSMLVSVTNLCTIQISLADIENMMWPLSKMLLDECLKMLYLQENNRQLTSRHKHTLFVDEI